MDTQEAPQGQVFNTTSCFPSPSCHWPTRAGRKGKGRELSAWMLSKVGDFQVCRAPPVWLSFWALCGGPSDHRVDLLLAAQGPKRLSVSKTRTFHLVFKDLRVGSHLLWQASLLPVVRPWAKQLASLDLALTLG